MINDPIQFDHAELSAPTPCSACKEALKQSYFQAAGQVFCGNCAEDVRKAMAGTGTRNGRAAWAVLLGIGAGILGAAIYFGVLALTGYNIGLMAIVVGYLVGRAVRRGSGGRGGLGYQFLAAGITYVAIATTFLPGALAELDEEDPAAATAEVSGIESAGDHGGTTGSGDLPEAAKVDPAEIATDLISFLFGIIALVVLTLSLPVLIAMDGGVISLLIVGFGVWEAWRVNKRMLIEISGPHELSSLPPTPAAADA